MTKYPGFRITVVHAITVVGDDDEEGIPAISSPTGMMPLIAANEERLHQIITLGQKVADDMGMTFKITRFSVREDIGEIVPKTSS